MPNRVKTVDRNVIQAWADAREGVPTIVEGPELEDHPQPLLIYFNDEVTAVPFSRKQISWTEFFREMDERGFAFVYEEDGQDPRYHEFVPRGS